MDDARMRAYQTLAVPNPNLPLRPHQVGYIELVSSPDPRIEPMVFALEHTRVRVGRFSTVGTYATSSDVYVAICDEATAISPMNTMFEYVHGGFHAFDTRSEHGTYVNGERIQRRRALVPGDVIDIGGIADEAGGMRGHARVVFLGQTPPVGRPIRRAPPRTQYRWTSHYDGAALDIDSAAGTARATLSMTKDWGEAAIVAAERVVGSPVVPKGIVAGAQVLYQAGEPLTEMPIHWTVELPRACVIVAVLCDALAEQREVLGPFDRKLLWLRPSGRPVLLGAGLSRVAFQLDAATKCGLGVSTPQHRHSPEEIMRWPVGPATDAFYAAYLLVELVTGEEPYPRDDYFQYLQAVRDGRVELPESLSAIAAAFVPDSRARPSLARLATLLRAVSRA